MAKIKFIYSARAMGLRKPIVLSANSLHYVGGPKPVEIVSNSAASKLGYHDRADAAASGLAGDANVFGPFVASDNLFEATKPTKKGKRPGYTDMCAGNPNGPSCWWPAFKKAVRAVADVDAYAQRYGQAGVAEETAMANALYSLHKEAQANGGMSLSPAALAWVSAHMAANRPFAATASPTAPGSVSNNGGANNNMSNMANKATAAPWEGVVKEDAQEETAAQAMTYKEAIAKKADVIARYARFFVSLNGENADGSPVLPSGRELNVFFHTVREGRDYLPYIRGKYALMGRELDVDSGFEIAKKLGSPEWKLIVEDAKSLPDEAEGKKIINPMINRVIKALYYGNPGGGKTTRALAESPAGTAVLVCYPGMDAEVLLKEFHFKSPEEAEEDIARYKAKKSKEGLSPADEAEAVSKYEEMVKKAIGSPEYRKTAMREAIEEGKPIILDEINLISDDVLRFLQNLTDNKQEFDFNSEHIVRKDGFSIIGTMNLNMADGSNRPLPAALVDRAAWIEEVQPTADMLAEWC